MAIDANGEWDGVCACGKRDSDGIRCHLGATHQPPYPWAAQRSERMPWDPPPVEDVVAGLQHDLAYAVRMTAIAVYSNRPELAMVANTVRGQTVPSGKCEFLDGTTVEFRDLGMPQPGAQTVDTVQDIATKVWGAAAVLGLELP